MLTDYSNDPMMCLLVDATRRADVSGPALAHAHRRVGEALATTVARYLPLEEVEIQHVAGVSSGARVRPGSEPIFIAMLRAGLFVAEGMWASFPASSLVLFDGHRADLSLVPVAHRTVVVVDAVVNTGKSLRELLDVLAPLRPSKLVAVTLVGYRTTMEALATERPETDFVAARLSERSYVGRGGTDTGARLFGTTTWGTET